MRHIRNVLQHVPILHHMVAKRNGAPRTTPIVPTASIAGHALVMVIAIMTFLAALTLGAVDMVRNAASGWEEQIAREVTIQVRPQPNQNIDAVLKRATDLARSTPGVTEARALTLGEIGELLRPWLGANVALEALPTPRLVVVRVQNASKQDLDTLAQSLKEIPGASLDDHRAWLDRLQSIGNNLVLVGFAILSLVLTATALSVLFATRGAMSGNSDIVDVLHVVGARDGFIARAFEKRFWNLGLKGGAIGGALAIVVFALGGWFSRQSAAAPDASTDALFGHFTISMQGYIGVLALVILISMITAVTSRWVVLGHLRKLT